MQLLNEGKVHHKRSNVILLARDTIAGRKDKVGATHAHTIDNRVSYRLIAQTFQVRHFKSDKNVRYTMIQHDGVSTLCSVICLVRLLRDISRSARKAHVYNAALTCATQ